MLLNLLPYLPRANELITQPTCHVAWYLAISYDITSRCLPGLHSLPAYSMFDFYVSSSHLCSTHNDCKIGIIGFFWIRQVVIRAGVYYSHLWAQLVITVRRQPTLQKTVVIGIDTKIEVIVASPTTWEAHHSPRAKPEGCGELPRSLVTQQWPKWRYQFLFYHDETKSMTNKQKNAR